MYCIISPQSMSLNPADPLEIKCGDLGMWGLERAGGISVEF